MKVEELAFIVQNAGIVHQYETELKPKTFRQRKTEKRLAKWGIPLEPVSQTDYEESKSIFEEYKAKYGELIPESKWNLDGLVRILVKAKQYNCNTVEETLKF